MKTVERLDGLIKIGIRFIEWFFKTGAVLKLLAVIAIAVVLVRFIGWLPTLQVKQEPLPQRIPPEQPQQLGVIAKDSGIAVIAEGGGKKLYIDPATLNLKITDDETGREWNAFRLENEAAPAEKSLFRLAFISEDNIITSWDSYTYSQKDGNYTIEKIPGGVRVNMQIGNVDPTDINAFMPRRIDITRYENTFVRALEEKAAQGAITEAEAGRYKTVLSLIYGKDEEGGFYYNKLRSSPPGSAVQQMLAMTRLLGYTAAQLAEDESLYNLPAVERRPPVGFLIPVDFTLDNGDLVAGITTENIEVQNAYYTLTKIHLLPNFGSVSAAEAESGYLFVPDGSGALIALNSFDPAYNVYERPLYWNTVFKDHEDMPQFPEDLKMPVFGMICEGGTAGGFLGIIEKGDETAFVGAKTASMRAGSAGDLYNTVYAGFDTSQYKQISIAGVVDDTMGGTYAAGTGMLGMDYSVRYKLFEEPAGYFEMASHYRQYLTEKYSLEQNVYPEPAVFLDVTGALTIQGRFLGTAYDRTVSMTEYSELTEILKDINDIPKTVSYNGVSNGGINNRLANRAAPVRQNGSHAEMETLLRTAADTNAELFMGANLARVSKFDGHGFNVRTHSAKGFNGEPAFFSTYDLPTRKLKDFSAWYVIVDPRYLLNVVDGFISKANFYGGIFVNDLAADYFAGYKRGDLAPPLASRLVVDEALRRLDEGKTLALNNPVMDKIRFAKWAVNISRESSNYGGFYTSIPFRQLVMNGLVRYTTLDANMSGERPDYYLLQAVELGSTPKFNITAKSSDLLKYTEHTEFLSTMYSVHRDGIREMYSKWNTARGKIGKMEIANHETLRDGVYRTTYSGGAAVTVNYNRFAAEAGGEEIPPMSFIIQENRR